MSALLELADRVEAATGPDREMDAAIRRAVYGDFGFCGDHGGTTYHGECPPEGCGKPVGMCDERTSHPSDWREDDVLPRFTASIDAAMTLVPEGRRRVEFGSYGEGRGWAYVHDPDDKLGECDCVATEILALCAAALRAHASGETE